MKKKVFKKIGLIITIATFLMCNCIYAVENKIETIETEVKDIEELEDYVIPEEDIKPYVTGFKNAQYVEEIKDTEYLYKDCFRIREGGNVEFKTGDNKVMFLSAQIVYSDPALINSLIIYINGENVYTKTKWDDSMSDLEITFKPNSNIKITFNSINKATNLLATNEVYLLGINFGKI